MIRVVKHAALDIGRLKGLTLLLALAAAVCLASLLNGGSGISGRLLRRYWVQGMRPLAA
jgi:hypothetical protein